MNLIFTDEQQALRDAARQVLAHLGSGVAAAAAEAPDGWSTTAALGWLGVSVPETDGGAGLGLLEETIVAEESGAALLPAPWFSTVALSLAAFVRGDGVAARELLPPVVAGDMRATLAWAEPGADPALLALGSEPFVTRAAGEGDAMSITGVKTWVPDAQTADVLVVPVATDGGPALCAVDAKASGLTTRPLTTFDDTRPLAEITFAQTPACLLASPASAESSLAVIRWRALTLAAAEAVGVAQRTLDLAVEYAGYRKQFGRIIGTYQGVSHKLADRYVALELSRALVIWAALAVDTGDPDAEVAVLACAAKALPEAVTTCEAAIQVFGGAGITWESPLHRYYRRAMALVALAGAPARHRSAIADVLFESSGVHERRLRTPMPAALGVAP